METGIGMIMQERFEQIVKHGYTPEKDIKYEQGELILLVEYLILNDDEEREELVYSLVGKFGFSHELLRKFNSKTRIEKLVVAGALLAAEIDRLKAIENEQIESKKEG